MSRINSYKCACACQADKQQRDNLQTDEEQRERQACEASRQRLPAGIQAQPAQQPAGVCHVCHVEDYSDDNLLLEVIVITIIPATTAAATVTILLMTIIIIIITIIIIIIITIIIINNNNNNNDSNNNTRFPADDDVGTRGEPHQLSMQWQSGLGHRQSLNTACYQTAATWVSQACASLDDQDLSGAVRTSSVQLLLTTRCMHCC